MSELEHYDNEIFATEQRINRLAIPCGLDLDNATHIAAVRNESYTFCRNGDEYSQNLLHEMLMLRDYVTLHCVDERGLAGCREIFEQVDVGLRQSAFEV